MMLFALLWDRDDTAAVDAGADPPVRPGESQRAVPTPVRAPRFTAAIPALYRDWGRGVATRLDREHERLGGAAGSGGAADRGEPA